MAGEASDVESWECPAAEHITPRSERRLSPTTLWLVFTYGLSSFVVLFCVFAPESRFVWNWLQFK